MRKLLLLAALCSQFAFGYASFSGFCEKGGVRVTTQGMQSTTPFMQSYPNASQSGAGPSVTVYYPGGTSKITIYSDNSGTPLANPFPCTTDGQYHFFASANLADVLFSGTGITSFTRASVPGGTLISYVTNYGAKGNGTTDDTTAIALAITTACAAPSPYVLLPAGYTFLISANVTPATPILPSCSNLTIDLEGTLKMKASSGSWYAIWSGAYSNFTLTGRGTLDLNSANNPPPSGADLGTYPRMAVHFPSGSNNRVNGIRATNVCSVWLYFLNSTNSFIQNTETDNVGNAACPVADASLLYCDPNSTCTVSGNRMTATAQGANMAATMIETHGNDTVIDHNECKNMATCVIGVGEATATVHGVSITNNVGTGLTGQGIMISSFSNVGATSYGLDGVLVSGNNMNLNVGTGGIFLDPQSNLAFRNIKISNNIVTYAISTSAGDPLGDSTTGIGDLGVTVACDSCDFSDNTVYNPTSRGVSNGTSGSNITMNNNVVVNPGSSLNPGLISAFRAGIFLAGTVTGTYTALNNTVVDSLGTCRFGYGIEMATGNTKGIEVSGTVRAVDATCTSLQLAVTANDITQLPLVHVIADVPPAKALPVYYVAPGSTIQVLTNDATYGVPLTWTWVPNEWDTVVPHIGVPVISSCNGGAASGADRYGYVGVPPGTAAGCTITFATAFHSQPFCTVSRLNATAVGALSGFGYNPGTSTLVISAEAGGNIANQTFGWSCYGN